MAKILVWEIEKPKRICEKCHAREARGRHLKCDWCRQKTSCPSCGGRKWDTSKLCADCRAAATVENSQKKRTREYDSEYRRNYRELNKNKLLSKERTQRDNYKAKNPVRYKAASMINGLGWGRGGTDKMENILRSALGLPCKYCGQEITIKNASPDHNIPRSLGGGNTPENIQIICFTCNRIKGDMTGDQMERLLSFLKDNPDLHGLIIIRLRRSTVMFGGGRR